MKTKQDTKWGLSITLRTALLSWLVTAVTLGIFVAVIIPEHKRTFLENLNSKAHGVAVSLRDVAAGAVVNEDYSSVVEHCVQMLNGDKSIDYLVITRNDGFSLIHDREKWYSVTNATPAWRPAKREITSGITVAPVFERRVFAYSLPFDYSGIQWGWINVGLSLESYDKSLAVAYRRTMILAAICVVVSLLASVVYAKRLVRPILSLRAVVQKVAGGDLSARAVIESRDEVGSLATSFNTMAGALGQRDQILQSVRFAAQQFLGTADWNTCIQGVLAKIGQAANASRACVFENRHDKHNRLLAFQRYEWVASDIAPQIDNAGLQGFAYYERGFDRWARILERGETLAGVVSDMPAAERTVLEPQTIRSLILIPIRTEGQWWGFLGLDDCTAERVWTEAERDSLRTLADMFGATISRQHAQEALVEAKETLEERVRQRTQELVEQVQAKEKAHTDLAQAQERLMAASRAASKAEGATSVLHNVGNVLNSVSVSATLVSDRLRQSNMANLHRATIMLREQDGHLIQFLTSDPKGKVLPEYLGAVAEQLVAERSEMLSELALLSQNIEHIKKIVAMQQNYATASGACEEVHPVELVEDALRMNAASFESHCITVIRENDPRLPRLNVDRHKALQILINLLRNAKHALVDPEAGTDRRLAVSVRLTPEGLVGLGVRDNGIGIAPENLSRIFHHGFTTKKDGHGFGLHSGANAAREMGGRLTAHSEGLGRGAEFTLELPVTRPERETSS